MKKPNVGLEEVIDDTSLLISHQRIFFLNDAIKDYNEKFGTSFNANEQFSSIL